MKSLRLTVGLLVLLSLGGFAQDDEFFSNVRTFQSFFRDAVVMDNAYGETGLGYSDMAFGSLLDLGVQGGLPVSPQLELGFGANFLSFSPDAGDGSSGIGDVRVSGIYSLVPDPSKIAAGGYITLPVGNEDVGAGDLDFGFFGAIRHPLNENMVLTGNVGIDFFEITTFSFNPTTFETEESTEYESSLGLSGGVINKLNDQTHIIGELVLRTEGDFFLLSGGVNHDLGTGTVRGALGVGLDDGAPDFVISASFLKFFN